MTGHALPADWLERLRGRLLQPPLRPRIPLLWRGIAIGSVEPALPAAVPAAGVWHAAGDAVHVEGEALTPALAQLAHALREARAAHAWRDELLPVCDEAGTPLGAIERAVVRSLGIATRAVHLVGWAPDGSQWVQQRALDKANDPGLWDTLMGGMVPASDTPRQALARETWEEAGLRLEQLHALRWRGQVRAARPTDDGAAGYMVETIDWWSALVPEGVAPDNQDGEVAQFRRCTRPQLRQMLLDDAFTLEAAGVLAASGLIAP